MIEKFAPVELGVSLDTLSDVQRHMLEKLVLAGMQMEAIFWKQTWSGAVSLRDRLRASSDSADRRCCKEVLLMMGPYDRLEEQRPFIAGALACRRRPSTCPTTSASIRQKARARSCCET